MGPALTSHGDFCSFRSELRVEGLQFPVNEQLGRSWNADVNIAGLLVRSEPEVLTL